MNEREISRRALLQGSAALASLLALGVPLEALEVEAANGEVVIPWLPVICLLTHCGCGSVLIEPCHRAPLVSLSYTKSDTRRAAGSTRGTSSNPPSV